MQFGWLSLIPPILVLALAVITKRVLPALIAGIATAAFIAAHYSPVATIKLAAYHAWQQVETTNLYTFGFLIILGAIIALLEKTGGTQAYARLVKNRLTNKKQAEMGTIYLSLCFMIDDFFSSITVGSIMRPLTTKFNISRAKLSYLIDSLAAPLVILVPVSSWIAMLSAQIERSGITTNMSENPLILADPFTTYVKSIPFIFYSLITLVAVLYIVQRGISFGPMAAHEQIADATGNLVGGKEKLKDTIATEQANGTIIDFLFPFISLFVCVFVSLLYTGGYWLFGGTHTLVQAFQHVDIFVGLFAGGLLAFTISFIFSLLRNTVKIQDIPSILWEGIDGMLPSIAVLFLAWTFGGLLREELQTGAYLAQFLMRAFPAFLLPSLFFVITTITSIAIGSSWGTIAIMVPLAVPMLISFLPVTAPVAPEAVPLLYPLIGAIFAGAIAGDHVSPIASTTLLSAASSGAYLSDHVHTQFIYALPVLIATTVSFLIAGILTTQPMWLNVLVSLSTGILLTLIMLQICNKKK